MVYCVRSDRKKVMRGRYDRMPDEPLQDWYVKWPAGKPLEPWMFDYFPSRLIVTQWPLAAVAVYRKYGVNTKIKAAIETIATGLHQFIPLTLVHDWQGETRSYDFFTLIVNDIVDAAIPEASDVEWRDKPLRRWEKKHGIPLVFDRSKLVGHHIWMQYAGEMFISDEMYDALKPAADAGGGGWLFEKQIEQ